MCTGDLKQHAAGIGHAPLSSLDRFLAPSEKLKPGKTRQSNIHYAVDSILRRALTEMTFQIQQRLGFPPQASTSTREDA